MLARTVEAPTFSIIWVPIRFFASSERTSVGQVGRRLLQPAEILRMGRETVVFVRGLAQPVLADRLVYHADRRFDGQWDRWRDGRAHRPLTAELKPFGADIARLLGVVVSSNGERAWTMRRFAGAFWQDQCAAAEHVLAEHGSASALDLSRGRKAHGLCGHGRGASGVCAELPSLARDIRGRSTGHVSTLERFFFGMVSGPRVCGQSAVRRGRRAVDEPKNRRLERIRDLLTDRAAGNGVSLSRYPTSRHPTARWSRSTASPLSASGKWEGQRPCGPKQPIGNWCFKCQSSRPSGVIDFDPPANHTFQYFGVHLDGIRPLWIGKPAPLEVNLSLTISMKRRICK